MALSERKEIARVFQLQKLNQPKVKETTNKERRVKLKKILKALYSRSDEIEQAIYNDFQKPPSEVKLTEIYGLIKETKYAIKHLKEWMEPEQVYPPITFIGSKNRIIYEPKGIALIISPWNYPFLLALNPMISAIAAGNCAIIKPSEKTPHTSAFIKRFIADIFDENEVAVFEGGKKTAELLLTHPFDHVFYTGGSDAGKLVMKAAADHLSSVTLELGGKSPVIIDKTANLQEAAKNIIWGKYLNAGQTCIAPDYVLVNENDKDKLIAQLKHALDKFYGDLSKIEENVDYCRIVSKKHFNKINGLVKDAVKNGAKLEVGDIAASNGNFISPTILSNVNLDMKVMQEEIFGPVLPVLTYKYESDIPGIIGANPKPLALYIFSARKFFIKKTAEGIPAGGVTANGVLINFTNSNLPFGGVNNSGIGKYHGYYGFKDFSNEKAFMKIPRRNAMKLLFPPYTPGVKKLIDWTLKYF